VEQVRDFDNGAELVCVSVPIIATDWFDFFEKAVLVARKVAYLVLPLLCGHVYDGHVAHRSEGFTSEAKGGQRLKVCEMEEVSVPSTSAILLVANRSQRRGRSIRSIPHPSSVILM
jgi:hypothetical protein